MPDACVPPDIVELNDTSSINEKIVFKPYFNNDFRYQNGKIYKLMYSNECIYIGCTYHELHIRLNQHIYVAKSGKGKTKLNEFMRKIDPTEVDIELIESFPCESRGQLEWREKEVIHEHRHNLLLNKTNFNYISKEEELWNSYLEMAGTLIRRFCDTYKLSKVGYGNIYVIGDDSRPVSLPRAPNFNYNMIHDEFHRLMKETKLQPNELWTRLMRLNTQMSTRDRKKLTPKVIEKCERSGLWLFAWSRVLDAKELV